MLSPLSAKENSVRVVGGFWIYFCGVENYRSINQRLKSVCVGSIQDMNSIDASTGRRRIVKSLVKLLKPNL